MTPEQFTDTLARMSPSERYAVGIAMEMAQGVSLADALSLDGDVVMRIVGGVYPGQTGVDKDGSIV